MEVSAACACLGGRCGGRETSSGSAESGGASQATRLLLHDHVRPCHASGHSPWHWAVHGSLRKPSRYWPPLRAQSHRYRSLTIQPWGYTFPNVTRSYIAIGVSGKRNGDTTVKMKDNNEGQESNSKHEANPAIVHTTFQSSSVTFLQSLARSTFSLFRNPAEHIHSTWWKGGYGVENVPFIFWLCFSVTSLSLARTLASSSSHASRSVIRRRQDQRPRFHTRYSTRRTVRIPILN